MKKLGIIALVVSGLALNANAADCESNLTVDGNFFKGKVYKTNAIVDGDTATAFKNVYGFLVKDGWKISSSDKEIGNISAGQEVSYGAGKSAPLNVLVEAAPDSKVTVSVSFSTSGGTAASKETVTKQFCAIIAEAGKK